MITPPSTDRPRHCGCGGGHLTIGEFRRGHDLRALRHLIGRMFGGSPLRLITYVHAMAAEHGIPHSVTGELQPWPRRLIDILPDLER
ncbi:hypothetical protein ACWDYH_39000 [Nocardia goodfellowii]